MGIYLCMLLYNSGKYISQSIGNMLPYVDGIMATVDTRTNDDTKQILDKWIKDGYKITYKDYQWQHHYGEAKNELIRMVPIDDEKGNKNVNWIIIYDDDEKLKDSDCKKLTDYIKSLGRDIGGLLIPRKNHYPIWDDSEEDYLRWLYPDRHMIVVRRFDGLGYGSRVHEWASNSVTSRGYKILIYDDVNTHHHAWKGSREKNESGKHYYYKALSSLGVGWKPGDAIYDNQIREWLKWEYVG